MSRQFVSQPYRLFALYLVVLLTGYMFLNKGFAYIGIPPLYVSEFGLAIGVVVFLVQLRRGEVFWHRMRQPVFVLLILFLFWQAVCTIPYLPEYGLAAARDAMLWGYAVYALLICLLIPEDLLLKFFGFYRKLIPWFLVWLPLAFILTSIVGFSPDPFNSGVRLITLKETDMGFHLAGVAAFLTLALHEYWRRFSPVSIWALWSAWWVSWIIYGSQTRAGMFSALIGIILAVLLGYKWSNSKPAVLTGAVVLSLLWASEISIPVHKPYKSVTISFHQLANNILSLKSFDGAAFKAQKGKTDDPPKKETLAATQAPSESPNTTVAPGPTKKPESVKEPPIPGNYRLNTIRWRLNWWRKILDYTFRGPYFWTGKGYGISLAEDDGFPNWDRTLRSPHNAFMTILARSGVPGLLLWLAFLSILTLQVLRARFHKQNDQERQRLAVWFLACLLAFLLNAFFDVFLEGPMAGIWFWSLIGFALIYFSQVKLPTGNHYAPSSVESNV